MTTIAYKAGVLAADSLSSYGDEREDTHAVKVLKSRDGRLIGICGDYAPTRNFAKALAAGSRLPDLVKDCGRVIEISVRGKIIIHEFGGSYPINERSCAWGSGSAVAKGVMFFGHSATDAVRAAIAVDKHTGGRVKSVSLDRRKK